MKMVALALFVFAARSLALTTPSSTTLQALRDARGNEITERWLIDTVESAPTGAVQGGGGSNPCERNGDPFGCQPRR